MVKQENRYMILLLFQVSIKLKLNQNAHSHIFLRQAGVPANTHF